MFDTARFIARLVTQPKTIGAVAPSSRALANAMAAQIDIRNEGPILELGPGTGVATAALIARGADPERITAIEYDPHFVRLIAQRFAHVHVIQGDAFDLAKSLDGPRAELFIGAISGVPLLNYTMERRQIFLAGVLSHLKPGAPYVQFSYGRRCPVMPPQGVSVEQAAFILFNLPPARVWVYRRR